jgi:hypothetical protein
MFRTEVTDDFSFTPWLLQQVAALMIPVIWSLITADVPVILEIQLTYPIGKIGAILWYALFIWGIGLGLALLVSLLSTRASFTGRWVWVLPMFFFLLFFVGESIMTSAEQALSDFFYTGPNGEGAWATALFTYPTAQAILYSLAMYFVHLRRQHPTK